MAAARSLEKLWAEFGDIVPLPLIVSVPSLHMDNPELTGAATPTTLTVQLDTQGGQHLLLPLTVKAAKKLSVGLAGMLQLQGSPSEPGEDEPPSVQ